MAVSRNCGDGLEVVCIHPSSSSCKYYSPWTFLVPRPWRRVDINAEGSETRCRRCFCPQGRQIGVWGRGKIRDPGRDKLSCTVINAGARLGLKVCQRQR